MLGETALELIRETLRSQDMLAPFNEDKVRSVLEEIKALYELFEQIQSLYLEREGDLGRDAIEGCHRPPARCTRTR